MDPYLEAPDIWEDFHANLAMEIQGQLTPYLRPSYIAALTPMVTYEEIAIEEVRRAKPDVGVVRIDYRSAAAEAVAIAPAPLVGEVAEELPVTSQSIEIRRVQEGTLVTAIEILSPVNKRPGQRAFDKYRTKRRDLMEAGVHVLEIDLLRGGNRPPLITPLPDMPYFFFLTRQEQYPKVEIWPLPLQQPFPIIPVPLAAPDPDIPLNLNQALQSIYDRVAYDLRIDYTQPPPPPDFSPEDAGWLDKHLHEIQLR
jgi:hypothetical protein